MNTKEVTAIAIKFFAIWLLVQVILQVPSLLLVFNNIEGYVQQEFPHNLYVSVVGSFLLIGIIASFLLYRVSNSVLATLPETNENNKNNISQQFLLQLGGVYFIVSAILLFLGTFTNIRNTVSIEATSYLYIIGALFELVIGITMLVKSSVWVHWLHKLRGRA